jgi:serine/threonine-protein kinase
VLIGTPGYLAPERATGAPATPAADLYALGIVVFQCLTGRLPFNGEPLAVALAHQEQPLPPLPPSVPAEVAALVADLTAKDPLARPASAGEVAERAEHLRAALTGTATRQRGQQNRRLAGLPVRAALAAAAIAGAGWVMAGVHGPTSDHPRSSPLTVTQQPSPRGSHPAYRIASARGTGSATEVPVQGRRPTASRKSSAPSAIPSGAATAAGAATPAGAPAPAGTPTPTGTPPPTGTPAPAGTPTPTGIPTPAGTPTAAPSATPTSGPATAAGSA